MIEARKNAAFEMLFDAYVRRLLRRSFFRIHVSGRAHVDSIPSSSSAVLFGNHSAWWDALLPYFLSRRVFRHDAYAMMEEKQLARYPFFRRIGVFSVDRDHHREAVRSLQYARELLRTPGRAVWMFPQGALLPGSDRPLVFERGIERLAEGNDSIRLVPFAFHYAFGFERLPEVYVAFGAPISNPEQGSAGVQSGDLAHRVALLRSGISAAIASDDLHAFEVVLEGRSSPGGRAEGSDRRMGPRA